MSGYTSGMRGCTSGFGRLGSMGVIDHKGGVPTYLTPQIAVIGDITSKLKQHYVSDEEAERQLDFLEKGGEPLDFEHGNASSLSVQSTLPVDQIHDQLGTSIVKDRLAIAAPPSGDSVQKLPLEFCQRSYWEFVLEEMAWLANDFAQERIWKISAAALIGHEASAAFLLKSHEQKSCRRQKKVSGDEQISELAQTWKGFLACNPGICIKIFGIQYLYCAILQCAQAESPMTPDYISDQVIPDMSWDTYLKEENLFYSVPTGAMKVYRKSVVSHLLQLEKTGTRKEEVQIENNKRRLDNHQLDCNGSSGLYVQQVVKKPKMMKQLRDNSVNILHLAGSSVPSPVVSQVSSMSNPSKFNKMPGGRKRGRKSKTLKAPAGQSGLGTPWSLFEDKALLILVHDMGPNWEFVSDAIGSISQFKCIFRKPKDCKERHKILMDSAAGDGANSAEDTGSSHPYWSTLPGIPKGIARHLFQHLQGPMEETTIKFHSEKIIELGKKQHCRTKKQKQLQVPHSSHTFALSRVCPNNMNAGPVLTPLDMCDATTYCSDELTLDYQSPYNGLLPISSPVVSSKLPTAGATPSRQASSDLALSTNFSSPGPLNTSVRFGIPRSASVSINEQQQNQLLSDQNIRQSSTPVHGVHADHSGVGNVSSLSKRIHVVSRGVHEIESSSMLNSGNLLSSGMVSMPSAVDIQSCLHNGPGNCMMRPRDYSLMMQPPQNLDHQRQLKIAELHMQVSQGSTKGVPPVGGSSSTHNQTTQTPSHLYPLHHLPHPMSSHQSHALGNSHTPHLQKSSQTSNTHHQVCVSRLAREKHIKQQPLLQQQYATSCALTPAVQGKSQLPLSSLQDFSQFQPQASSPPVSLAPMTQYSKHSQRHQIPPHGAGWNPQVGGGLTNQTEKQRHRQPQQRRFQQAVRHHPQLRKQSRSRQQAKTLSIGRGPKEHAFVNGLSNNSGSQSEEKGELVFDTMRLVTTSPHALPQQEMYSGQFYQHTNTDISYQNHVVSTMAATVQTVASPVAPSSEQQQSSLQPQAQPQLHAEPNSNIVDQA